MRYDVFFARRNADDKSGSFYTVHNYHGTRLLGSLGLVG